LHRLATRRHDIERCKNILTFLLLPKFTYKTAEFQAEESHACVIIAQRTGLAPDHHHDIF